MNAGKFKLTITTFPPKGKLAIIKVVVGTGEFGGTTRCSQLYDLGEFYSDNIDTLRLIRDEIERHGGQCEISTTYFKEFIHE